MRLSAEYIKKCDEVKDVPNGWLDVTDKMQKELVKSFGFDDPISNDIACYELRTAHIKYPNNPVFKESIFVKYNKANEGKLKVNDLAPNVKLHTLDNKEIELSMLLESKLPTVIFSGSHT